MTVPGEPYVAVIFTSTRTDDDEPGYGRAADQMEAMAAEQPGYLGIDSARSPDGQGITVSYWRSQADAVAWKRVSEHRLVQQLGRERWYASYTVRVATVEREYSYTAGETIHDAPTGNNPAGETIHDAAAGNDPAGVDPAADDDRLLFHAALPADWSAAQPDGEYRWSTRGVTLAQEGFIHCSRRQQVEGVANRFYGDLDELVLLRIDPDRVGSPVVDEPPADGVEELFPHVYGPIPVDAVVSATRWTRMPDSAWAVDA